jgi:hypothetical protein
MDAGVESARHECHLERLWGSSGAYDDMERCADESDGLEAGLEPTESTGVGGRRIIYPIERQTIGGTRAVDLGSGQTIALAQIDESDTHAVAEWLQPLVEQLG